jgi:hypothetical protein
LSNRRQRLQSTGRMRSLTKSSRDETALFHGQRGLSPDAYSSRN